MPLIKCKECGNENSKDAATCPKCGKRLKMGVVRKLGLLGVIVCLMVVGAIAGGEKKTNEPVAVQAVTAPQQPKAPIAPKPSAPPPAAVPVSVPPSVPAGVEHQWGQMLVTMREAVIRGKVVSVTLMIKNPTDQDENISSLMHFQALSEEGDKGDMDWMATKCDGSIPRGRQMKCTLVYKFPAPPKDVDLQVGAGLMTEALHFRVQAR
jgi:zinc-ribbon domain